MEWLPIESASCVGKKRLLFALANGRIAAGWRLTKTDNVLPEGCSRFHKATHWMPLPPPPSGEE